MKAIKTGSGVASVRAMMSLYPREKRLFEDPYSEKLLSPFLKFFIRTMRIPKIRDFFVNFYEKNYPGMLGWFLCRDRYIDDILKDSLEKKVVETIVNLGAGLDCRAYYIPGIENVSCFEVDHPAVMKMKTKKLKKILGDLPGHVVYVPVDFQKQSLDAELKKAGYNLNSRTLFIWEAVTQYISEEANESAVKYMARAASGSRIVFSYIIKSFFEGSCTSDGVKKLAKHYLKKNNPLFISGFDPADMKNYLANYDLNLIEDVDAGEMQERYARLVDFEFLNTIKEFDMERFVLAGVKR